MSGLSALADSAVYPETHIVYPRPSFKITAQHPGTDLVANTAAAFAAGSVIYAHTLGDKAYAARLLKRAESLYEWAVTGKQGKYSDSVPAAKDSYASRSQLVLICPATRATRIAMSSSGRALRCHRQSDRPAPCISTARPVGAATLRTPSPSP